TMTQAAERNVELLRKGYQDFGRGDLPAVQAAFAPDAVWHAQRLGRLTGDHAGWPAIARFFGLTMELTGGTFRVEVQDVMANDGAVAVVVRSSGRRGAHTLGDRQVHLFRVEAELVREVWQYVGDVAAIDAFWG